ncbi:hypothetical protein B0O80DRAFT_462541 [Mortierella sp. GBAus27b]|nr:hypothetical protein B0O80DRAFT_462541 [Mortierella sp. GBAus27b]
MFPPHKLPIAVASCLMCSLTVDLRPSSGKGMLDVDEWLLMESAARCHSGCILLLDISPAGLDCSLVALRSLLGLMKWE